MTRLLETIRKAVCEEVRAELLLHGPQLGELPLPSDTEAERIVVRAVCLQQTKLSELRLRPEMFFVPIHKEIMGALSDVHFSDRQRFHPSLVTQLMAVRGIGSAERFLPDVRAFFDDFGDAPESVYPAATKVQRAFRARETCKLLAELNRRLRLGEITPEQVELSFRWLRVPAPAPNAPPEPNGIAGENR